MILLDTDVLIDVQRGHPPALAWFSNLAVPPSVPGLVVMELIQDARNNQEVRRALRLVSPFLWYGGRRRTALEPCRTLPRSTSRTASGFWTP